jgi:hypothetical protein
MSKRIYRLSGEYGWHGVPVPKIYLDACTLNRLTDDQSQPRIHSEAEAVERVLYLVWKGEPEWMASTVLEAEIRRNPDRERRNDALKLISFAGELLRPLVGNRSSEDISSPWLWSV